VLKVARTGTFSVAVVGGSGAPGQCRRASSGELAGKQSRRHRREPFLFAGFRGILQTHAIELRHRTCKKSAGCQSPSKLPSSLTNTPVPSLRTRSAARSARLQRHIFARQFRIFYSRNFTLPMYPSGAIWSMLERPLIQDGFIHLPERPGLGVRLNEEVTRQYARKGEPFFQ
jgi:hypothetical protein